MVTPERPAIAGGRPVRSDLLPFARASLGSEEETAVIRVLRSGWLTTGPETESFERELAQALSVPHVVALSSCTAALHLALTVLDRAGEVVTTPFTFASTIAAIRYAGCVPVLVDIDPVDLTIDPERVALAISPRTVAVLGVDYAGQPIRVAQLRAVIPERDIRLVEDAAHSLGARVEDQPVGAVADITCFSFYATKNITTGEGGALSTFDGNLAQAARELRLHGMDAGAWQRYLAGGDVLHDIQRMGFKYNLSDVASAIGRVQLRREPELRTARRRIALTYRDGLADLEPLIRLPIERPATTHAWHLYPILLDLSRLSISRGDFLAAMRAEGISCSVHFTPVHELSAYRDLIRQGPLSHAEAAGRTEVSLPIWPDMGEGDVQNVVHAVRKIVMHFAA